MLICVIRSLVTIRPTDEILEPGFHELPVHVKMSVAAATGDALGFVQNEIAQHLAKCVSETGLPLKEGLWNVEFTNFAQNNFNFPKGFTA